MKLLIINYMALPIPPVNGGAVEYLIDSFLKDNEEKHLHDITVYSIYDEKAQMQAADYKYTEFKYIKINSFFDKLDRVARHIINKFPNIYVGNTYISKVLRQEKNLNQYDAIIMENAPAFALNIPKTYKNKLILHLHNDYLNKSFKKAKKIFDLYDAIYTISDSLGNDVQTIEKSDKVKTLYNGIDLERFSYNSDTRNEIRRKYNIADDDFVFMFCGRIVYDKGVLELVKAFSNIKDEKVKLIIAGRVSYSNKETSDYLEEIYKYTNENVIFTGFIPYKELHSLYTAADVGCVPSIFNDPFNLTLIEFCANNVPVIISDRGAMKELVNDKCSIIAKCDEEFSENIYKALKAMLDNRDKLPQMGTEAKIVSERFSINRYCDRFNKLLSDLKEE